MRQQRGTSDATLAKYNLPIRELLTRFGNDPRRFDAQKLRQFVLERSQQCGWAAAKKCTIAVRMFLRFLTAAGRCRRGLDAAIPPCRTGDFRPCPGTWSRKRSNASLRRVIRLRQLADGTAPFYFCWRVWGFARVILFQSVFERYRLEIRMDTGVREGPSADAAALTQEVGDAIARIFRMLGRDADGTLFVCSLAPFRPFASHGTVSVIVDRAMRRAGVTPQGCSASAETLARIFHVAAGNIATGNRRHSSAPLYSDHRNLRQSRRPLSSDRSGVAGGGAMLATAVESYLAIRRAVGFKLK